jgi:hypothetical protein
MELNREILIGRMRAGVNRGFTTNKEPLREILCAYDLTKFCSPECSACMSDVAVSSESIDMMCKRGNFTIGVVKREEDKSS